MAYKIRRLNDETRKAVAEEFTPYETRDHAGNYVKLNPAQREAITAILRGALLACFFDDNRYEYPGQVAYMCECIASYDKRLKNVNQYDVVFCPCDSMLRKLHEEVK